VTRLGDLTKDEFATALQAGAWLLLPFGSMETHGPNFGFGADTIAAAHVCRAVTLRGGGLVAPTLPYGVCRTMRNRPGTVSLSVVTFITVGREVVAEYVRHGARYLALYSGHAEPAQFEALREGVLPIVDAEPRPTVLVVGPYAFLDPVRRDAPRPRSQRRPRRPDPSRRRSTGPLPVSGSAAARGRVSDGRSR